MQKLQESVFSIVKTTNLSPAVFNFLQPTEECADKAPLGGILSDSKHGWLALGPKFCVVDLRSGLKVAARTFGTLLSKSQICVTSVIELPTPLTSNSKQLLIGLECEDLAGLICVFHVNGSQLLQCIQTEFVVTELAVCDGVPDGWLACFDGVVMAGTRSGEIFAFDLNRAGLIQALKDISNGYEHLIKNESNPANVTFLSLNNLPQLEEQRDLALENDDHIGIVLNQDSIADSQFVFRNPDNTVRMKAKRDHVRVTALKYIPQLGSLAVGYNFGAFQIWNIMTLDLEYTSQVNVECLPVTHFGFQEPCDDPRAFCYLWVIFSLTDRFEDEGFPLAVMYSFTYQGKRMLSDTTYLYQEFSSATIRFQVELGTVEDLGLLGGKCLSCHTYSVSSTLGDEGEDGMLNLCHLVWECWGEHTNSVQYGMLLFDLDQWYKDQMPATTQLHNNVYISTSWCELSRGNSRTMDVRLLAVSPYCHATSTEEHFYPNSLHYNCICLNTSEACVLNTIGVQRQIISSMDDIGPTALLNPTRLYKACVTAGLTPLYVDTYSRNPSQEEQRRYLLSVALEARLSRLLKRCAHDWATGSHANVGCTLAFLMDWCWDRAMELKENAKELTAPLFTSASLPDRNVVRCLEHCVQQLTQLTGLLDAVLTKCCNLVVPDALSEMEEKYAGIGTVSLYLQVVQWFLRVGLLPERHTLHGHTLPYPQLNDTYTKRRIKLQRLLDNGLSTEEAADSPCPLLYIDQLIEQEFGGERLYELWRRSGSEWNGLYPPPSLYSLLRLYLIPDIPEEHKHSLMLYLLVDYSMLYDDARYETIIRRLMQFPTMFGLSNTAIKATQAFWHLDHRDFDFALDQLQCLTGNTLSEWQHNVVLSSLLAQKKTQAALQYLHVRKPAPIQSMARDEAGFNASNRVNDHDKLEDWQSCCNLYLARHLVFEALDVIRMCVSNAATNTEKEQVLNFFYKGCRNTGQLSKILQVTLLPFEEQVFINYLQSCNESQTSDILIMYYLQQARYLEAEQYLKRIKHKPRIKELTRSVESIDDGLDRENARDILVDVMCSSLPNIANTVASIALTEKHVQPNVLMPKPMSVFIQAKSPKNTFIYKSSFIQDTIENASETWINKPQLRRGMKRALNVEDTPFICTPKLSRTKSIFSDMLGESTPPKRSKFDMTGSPKTPKTPAKGGFKLSEKLTQEMAALLDMPEYQSPEMKAYNRSGAGTPHSILKIRKTEERELASPVDSRYLGDSDEEFDTASQHTHYSDSAKHLRFTIPAGSEGSTPSPVAAPAPGLREKERVIPTIEMDDSFVTTTSRTMSEENSLESPPKKLAVLPPDIAKSRKSYKDSVKGRRSLSISVNSSLSDDPNTSIESIADIPITLINPRYSGEKTRREKESELSDTVEREEETDSVVIKTPKGRRCIRDGESTLVGNRSRSGTPERQDSPITTPMRSARITRSRSRTPELSPRSLEPIIEQPKHEVESEEQRTTLSVPLQLRSRSRTPERFDKGAKGSPRLEVISESPTKTTNLESSPSPRRSLRSRSRTPELEVVVEQKTEESPRRRGRSKTPDKMSTKSDQTKARKSLSRMVLEANTFAKTKQIEKMDDQTETDTEKTIECTPMKTIKPSFMDVTLSPIVNKSILQSEESLSETIHKEHTTDEIKVLKSVPFTITETFYDKSILKSYHSSAETSQETKEIKEVSEICLKPLPAFQTFHDSDYEKSVLRSYQSSVADTSDIKEIETKESAVKEVKPAFRSFHDSDFDKSVLRSYQSSVDMSDKLPDTSKSVLNDASSLITNDSDADMKDEGDVRNIRKEKETIGEIEREINEIEGEMSDDCDDPADSESDEEIIEPVGEDSESDSSDNESSEIDGDEEIISIKDTDEESSSSEGNLQINEQNDEQVNIEPVEEIQLVEVNVETATVATDPLNQGQLSLLTDDNSGLSDKSDVNLNYSDETKEKQDGDSNATENVPAKVTEANLESINKIETDDNKNTEIVIPTTVAEVNIIQTEIQVDIQPMDIEDIPGPVQKKNDIIVSEEKDINTDPQKKTGETEQKPKNETIKDVELKESEIVSVDKQADITEKNIDIEEQKKPATRTRRRASSTASNKSKVTDDEPQMEEPKTPMTRKRTQSQTSVKSELDKTPESVKSEELSTPRRRRTPTSEVRKIITRRTSKELNDSDVKEEVTPRRSTRRSKTIDDNSSVTSETSIKSKLSDMSDIKPAAVRKGRKSILSAKPDLSVIPENTIEESSKVDEETMAEYSSSRRLTRNQKSLLASLNESKPAPRRRPSTASRTSVVSEQSVDDDASSTHSATFDVQPIDRITLLNKEDFAGSPDRDEVVQTSPESLFSDTSKTRPRLARAASEAKTTPKAKSIRRRTSVDTMQETPEIGSPLAGGESPGRNRRASFNRAVEALHTPKGRRASIDHRKGDSESVQGSSPPSESGASPGAAAVRRRRSSAQSNTSLTKADSARRSKLSTVEEK